VTETVRQKCPLCQQDHLDVTTKNGKVLVNCWTDGCAGQTKAGRVEILKKLGLGLTASRDFTIAQFCSMKKLPQAWAVEHFHIRDDYFVRKDGKVSKDLSVAFPYFDLDGKLVGTRFRFNKNGDGGWHGHDPEAIVPFGLPQICAGDIEQMVMIMEGESNCMTMQHVCLPAISVAGAKTWKPRYAEIPELAEVETIYIFQDPDEDGRKFVRKVAASFPAGKCRVVGFTQEEEDISAMWINSASPSAFADALIVKLRESKIIGATVEVQDQEPGKKDYDLPSAALDGFLGQTCLDYMSDFPRSYAYLALLAVASVRVPMSARSRCNLYVAMIGESGFGKTASVERGARLLSTELMGEEANSGEGLVRLLEPYKGRQCLLWQEELCKLFAKARVENSSILPILNKLWGVDTYTGFTKKDQTSVNTRLTLVGGLPTSDFGIAFGAESVGGVYRRMLFADQPPDIKPHLWRDPLEYEPVWTPPTIVEGDPHEEQERLLISRPVSVHIAKSVWDERDRWAKDVEPHLIEPVLRAAVIAASFDGRRELTADHLEPAYELLKYQEHVRQWLRPNTGVTSDGKLTRTFLNYLRRYAADGSEITRRKLIHATHAYDYGSAVSRRVLEALERDRMIEFGEKHGKADTVRLHPREVGVK
jgi:hypothetical protein